MGRVWGVLLVGCGQLVGRFVVCGLRVRVHVWVCEGSEAPGALRDDGVLRPAGGGMVSQQGLLAGGGGSLALADCRLAPSSHILALAGHRRRAGRGGALAMARSTAAPPGACARAPALCCTLLLRPAVKLAEAHSAAWQRAQQPGRFCPFGPRLAPAPPCLHTFTPPPSCNCQLSGGASQPVPGHPEAHAHEHGVFPPAGGQVRWAGWGGGATHIATSPHHPASCNLCALCVQRPFAGPCSPAQAICPVPSARRLHPTIRTCSRSAGQKQASGRRAMAAVSEPHKPALASPLAVAT